MAKTNPIIGEAKVYVTKLLADQLSSFFYFHSIQHTLEVAEATRTIAHEEGLIGEEAVIVTLAALFHDVGFISAIEGHEEVGRAIASQYLISNGMDTDFIEAVGQCIMATELNSRPKSQLGNIIRDADLHHLSTEHYWSKNHMLRKELELTCNLAYADDVWLVKNYLFLLHHEYHTDYGRSVLRKGKEERIRENEIKIEEALPV